MSNKTTHRIKKNSYEKKEYESSLAYNRTNLNGTYEEENSFLSGSDNFEEDLLNESLGVASVKRKPIGLSMVDWFKKNAIATIVVTVISGIIAAFIIWVTSNLIEVNKEQAVFEYRLTALEEVVESIPNTVPNKEVLEIELNNIKEKVDNIELNDLEERIENLESEIKRIRSKNG